jgi:MFS transporter, FHS family, L-fucose permease
MLAPEITQNEYIDAREKHGLVNKNYLMAFVLVTSLFFMWAIFNNFNDILIKQFQKALDLTRMQSGLVQTAFYFGYFTIALPAGMVMRRFGYKNGIVMGLILAAVGAMIFYPAAEARSFAFFLFALFVIASGLTFLETAANPFITVMGDKETAAQRLNLAQSFNGLGGFIAPFIGGALIFSGIEYSAAELAALSPEVLDAYRTSEARAVQVPYLVLAVIVIALALVIYKIPFPQINENAEDESIAGGDHDKSLFSYRHLKWAIVAQFFYVGAQVGIWSYFINYSQDLLGIPEKTAANYLGFSLMAFMVGRFSGTFLMHYIEPAKLLTAYGLINMGLCSVAIFGAGVPAVIALGLTSFFMSVMYPTIFALGVKDLGSHTKIGSSVLVMAIVGGALFPPLMGTVADLSGSIQYAIFIPLLSFLIVLVFGMKGHRSDRDIQVLR